MITKFYEDGKTKEELLENIEIQLTTFKDAEAIVDILCKTFDIPSFEMGVMQLITSKADLDNSVKVVDKRDNKIYGFLIFSEFEIDKGSPIRYINKNLSNFLLPLKQINGHSFVLDERLRGAKVDKQMLLYQKDYLQQYDIVWCGVENELNTHSYWKRLGFIDAFSNQDAKFYIKSFDKNIMLTLFIMKMLSNEKNRN